MGSYVDPILIVEFISSMLAAIVIYISLLRGKLEGFTVGLTFAGVVFYGWFGLADKMSIIYSDNNSFYNVINLVAKLEPDLITTWNEVALWVAMVIGLIVISTMLTAMIMLDVTPVIIRGARLMPENLFRRMLNKLDKAEDPIKVGQFSLPLVRETRSLAIYGEPGCGKTQIILGIIRDLIKREDRFVCLDVGGDIYSVLGNSNDTILSAIHAESTEYSPFADINKKSDCNVIANSFIPKGSGDTEAWNGYARAVLTVIFERCFELSKTTNKDLLYFGCEAGIHVLRKLVKGTSVQRIFEGKNEKKVDDIMGIISQHLKPLSMFSLNAGLDSFSLRAWVKNNPEGNLWIIYEDASALATAPLRTMWMNLLIQETLSLGPDSNRRLCYVMDELASSGVIDGLSNAVSRGRKYGMSFVFAVQNLSQLYQSYGRDEAHSILGSVGHIAVLRSPDPDTSEYLSKCIGEVETEREQISTHAKGGGVNVQVIRETKRAVLPSEISDLNDLNGFIKVSGVGWSRLKVPFIKLQRRNTLRIKRMDCQPSEEPKGSGASPFSIDDV